MKPYYEDDQVTLYLGDCREITGWVTADVLVTDPPYGRGWRLNAGMANLDGRGRGRAHAGIAGDDDSSTRDAALALWGERPAVVFGDLLVPNPAGTAQVLVYAKPIDAGIRGARNGYRRDVEAIYLVGPWPLGVGGRTSVLRTRALVAGPKALSTRYGHPHAKPVDLMAELIGPTEGVIADPFTGAGSTLVAAKMLGRRAIGVELDEAYCEAAAKRLAEPDLFMIGDAS